MLPALGGAAIIISLIPRLEGDVSREDIVDVSSAPLSSSSQRSADPFDGTLTILDRPSVFTDQFPEARRGRLQARFVESSARLVTSDIASGRSLFVTRGSESARDVCLIEFNGMAQGLGSTVNACAPMSILVRSPAALIHHEIEPGSRQQRVIGLVSDEIREVEFDGRRFPVADGVVDVVVDRVPASMSIIRDGRVYRFPIFGAGGAPLTGNPTMEGRDNLIDIPPFSD